MNGEGCSISTISRFLRFSTSTVCRWIEKLSGEYNHEVKEQPNQEYQADDLRTFIGSKKNECWIMYGINKCTKSIVALCVGRRTSENLRLVTNAILACRPKLICTDRLIHYRALIPKEKHDVKEKKTNHIERMNLQFRTQLKRLSRKTICFSRSESMLRASVNLGVKYMNRGSNSYEFVL
jgi:insertion element IS1 protein InsB